MSDSIQPTPLVYLASFGALLGALSMGLALGYTAPAFLDMEKDLGKNSSDSPLNMDDEAIRESQKSLIGSMLAIGALVGGFLGQPCNQILGRRISLIAYGAPFIMGWILIAVAKSVGIIVFGRLLTGLCCGLVSGTAPTYVVEIAPPKIRGLLGTCFQVMVVIGILLASVFGTFMSWSVLAAFCLIPSIGTSSLMFFMPETPQWLLSKGRNEEAEAALKRLRASQTTEELATMTQTAQAASEGGTECSISLITNREFYKPLLMALGLMFFQQFSGINAVLFYQTDIFKKAYPESDPILCTILVCLAQVIMTLVGSFLVDRLGRRILLLTSGAGHAISLVLFGACFNINKDFAWVSVLLLVTFVSSFSLGFGPVPWMMIPEFSSSRVRSLVASIATAFNWTCVYIVTATIKSLLNLLGDAGTYWIYAVICAVSCLFVFFVLPETKGKTSEQIQEEMFGSPTGERRAAKRAQGEQMKELI